MLFPIEGYGFYSLYVKKLLQLFSSLTDFTSPGTIPLYVWSEVLCSEDTYFSYGKTKQNKKKPAFWVGKVK